MLRVRGGVGRFLLQFARASARAVRGLSEDDYRAQTFRGRWERLVSRDSGAAVLRTEGDGEVEDEASAEHLCCGAGQQLPGHWRRDGGLSYSSDGLDHFGGGEWRVRRAGVVCSAGSDVGGVTRDAVMLWAQVAASSPRRDVIPAPAAAARKAMEAGGLEWPKLRASARRSAYAQLPPHGTTVLSTMRVT